MLSGVLLIIPFAVTLVVLRWVFGWLRGLLRPLVEGLAHLLEQFPIVGTVPDPYIRAAVLAGTIVLLLALLYLIGVFGRFVIIRRLITTGERLMMRIPLVRNIYGAAKQVVDALTGTPRSGFKSVVLVEFPRPGYMAVGFLTGTLTDSSGRAYSKVFIPTTPNPTTGFLEIIPSEEVQPTGMSVEEAFKMIISGGLVSGDLFVPRQQARHVAVNADAAGAGGSAPRPGPAGREAG